ncbi:MAG: tetratricopeptide repeat protein [Sedimentisphaerales bacterium]|nr:tetratricopeptide repeat protein [Sedimentisphaerales bacterium]
MRSEKRLFWCITVVLVGLCGCAGPRITVRHELPRVVDLPEDSRFVADGDFLVQGYDSQEVTKKLKEAIAERFSGFSGDSVIEVGGRVVISHEDHLSMRQVSMWNYKLREEIIKEVDSLVRQVDVAVEFTLMRAGAEPVVIAVRHEYSSRGDPRVWGELGMERVDDPDRVPAVAEIVEDLLSDCVETLYGIVAGVELVEEVQMRATLNSAAGQGAAAAEKGDFAGAIDHLQAAHEQNPKDVNVAYNLAVVLEAAGRLEEALAKYLLAEELSGGDEQIRKDAERVEKVLWQREAAK